MADPEGRASHEARRDAEPPTTGDRRPVALVPPSRRKHGWLTGLVAGLTVFAFLFMVLIGMAVTVLYILAGTDWGRDRVRRYAESAINGAIHGRVRIGRLSGNLLASATAHDVTITDTAGKPFVAVESVRGTYSILSLLRKRIWINHVTVVRPRVVLDRPPGGHWNWQRIFQGDTMAQPPHAGWGTWVSFTDVSVVQGQLIVNSPWHPRTSLKEAARDSAIRQMLSGSQRLNVKRVPRGFQKVVRLDSLSATVPLLLLAEPGLKIRFAQISEATTRAYPFRPPAAIVRDVKGIVSFTNDSAWWKGAYVALPRSKATGDGVYEFDSGDLRVSLHSERVNSADMRWIYPRLPANGEGKLDLKLSWRASLDDYLITNADLRLGEARASGSFGISLDDTTTIRDTHVRFSGVDTRTLEQLIPSLQSPRRGVLSGRATVSGGRRALDVNGDVAFDDQRAGTSRVIASGRLGFPQHGVRATNLRVEMLPVKVDMGRTWIPSLPIGGLVTGTVTLNGSTNGQMSATGKIDHRDRGTRSILDGSATVRLSGGQWFDIDVNARPVSLVEVGRFFPAAGLRGSAAGPVHLTGSLSDLRVVANLRLPDGGHFSTRGSLDLAAKEKGYDLTARLSTLNLRTITHRAPVTSLTAQIAAAGRGLDPRTMQASVKADFATSRWDTIGVDTASVRGKVGAGLAEVQRLYVGGSHAVASVSGSFGLTRARTGTLTYRITVDSLGAFNRWIPRSSGDTVAIAPRPRGIGRAFRRARADSARIDRATEMERLISGRPGPRLAVNAPKPVRADTLSGAAHAEGSVSGNIYEFDLRGHAGGESVVARGNFARRFESEYAWMNARTSQEKIVIALDADSVSVMGFAFDTIGVRFTYSTMGGHAEAVVVQDEKREYSVKGDYSLSPDRTQLKLANLTFRSDTAFWSMPRPAYVRWGRSGAQVSGFELKNLENGRIYANGLLPIEGAADFQLDIEEFPISDVADLLQMDVDMRGTLTLHGTLNGTLKAPTFRGTFALAEGMYNKTVVPELRGRVGYADRAVVTHVDVLRKSGESMATVDGRVPINLAMTGVTGSRILSDPMSVDLVADSLPLELIPEFTDVVSNVHGRAGGQLTLRGTLKKPSLVGGFLLDRGTVTLTSTGATFDQVAGAVRVANDSVYIDSIVGQAKGPVRVRGTLGVADWSEPTLNVSLTSSGAELLHNDKGRVRVDARLALSGPFKSAYLTGSVTVTQGVIYAPEPTGRHVVGAGDPALFNVLDTSIVSDRELFPAQSPLLANLRVDVSLSIRHNTWVRNREANIEVYTEDPVVIHAEEEALSLTGVVTSDRGSYNFFSKRFQIKRGSATFVGSPDLNPTLQLTGEYEVWLPSRGALNIRVLIGGTLRKPTLSLESDAQPPRTQSELLSLLAFGESATALLATGSSSIAGSAATSDLFGVGAQAAARRLAGVALGVAADQLESQATRAFGTDMFDITPTDAPSGNIVGNLFTQTKFEAGKYINPRTFVTVQTQAWHPGAGIEHRTADGWQFNANISPRLILGEPTLTSQPFRVVQTYGGFIVREWRF